MWESNAENTDTKKFGPSTLKLSFLMLFLMMFSLGEAGYYDVTYSGGGTIKVSHLVPFQTGVYTPDTSGGADAYGGGGNAMPAPLPDGPPIASFTCFGDIEAEFTWVPEYEGDSPPASILLYERSAATWSGLDGNCDNGIGGEVQNIYQGTDRVGAISESDRVTVMPNPGDSFVITVSPLAAGTSYIEEGRPPKGCTASVRYAAAAWVPTVVQLGSQYQKYGEGYGFHAMIGQRIDHYVDVVTKSPWDGTYFINSKGNHDWKASGGVLLDGYSMSSSFEYRLNRPDLITDEPNFKYFQCSSIDAQTDTSASFDLTVGDLGTYPLTAATKTFFYRPELSHFAQIRLPNGKAYFDPVFITVSSRTEEDLEPIRFFGNTLTPPDLLSALPPRSALCQILDWYLLIDGSEYEGNTEDALDNRFPYELTYHSESLFPGYLNEDAPQYKASIWGASNFIDASFTMYYLYYPPAITEDRRMPVPISRIDWFWSGSYHRMLLWEGNTDVMFNPFPGHLPHIDQIQWTNLFLND